MSKSTVQVFENVRRGNTQDGDALRRQPSVPLFISLWSIAKVMRTTIDFHCKAGRRTEEVENIRTGGVLAAKADAASG